MKPNNDIETLHTSTSVTIIRKKSERRPHQERPYQFLLLRLRQRPGTKVRATRDGIIEYMPAVDELQAIFAAMRPVTESSSKRNE